MQDKKMRGETKSKTDEESEHLTVFPSASDLAVF